MANENTTAKPKTKKPKTKKPKPEEDGPTDHTIMAYDMVLKRMCEMVIDVILRVTSMPSGRVTYILYGTNPINSVKMARACSADFAAELESKGIKIEDRVKETVPRRLMRSAEIKELKKTNVQLRNEISVLKKTISQMKKTKKA